MTRIDAAIKDEIQARLDAFTKNWRQPVQLVVKKPVSRPGEFEVHVEAPVKTPRYMVNLVLSQVENDLEEKYGGLRLLMLADYVARARSKKRSVRSNRSRSSK